MYSGYCSIEWTGSCSGSEYVSGIPYGNQTEEDSLVFEDGFKGVRGYLTEGRFLVFESNGYALTNPDYCEPGFSTSPATATHESIDQRWVLHALTTEGTTFQITSALDNMYISQGIDLTTLQSAAEIYNVTYIGSSEYTLQSASGAYLNINSDGSISYDSKAIPYNIYSVTYHS